MCLLRENPIGIAAFAQKKIVVRAGFDDCDGAVKVNVVYSWRSASIGSRRAARMAG